MHGQELDALLAGLDEGLAPIDPEAGKQADDANKAIADAEADDNKADDIAADDKGDDADDDAADDDAADDDADKGVSISELESADDDKTVEPVKPTEPAKADPNGFNPEQRFIYDGLTAVAVQDKEGKVYNVKTYAELPADFEFFNKSQEVAFLSNMNSQELNARELQSKYRSERETEQREAAQKDWNDKEQLADKLDIDELQKAGDFPLFKVRPTDKGFEDSEPAKLMAAVLEYKDELNQAAFERSQEHGITMRIVGFKEALALYNYYDKGGKPAAKKDDAQASEDKARKDLAKRTNKPNGTQTKDAKPRPQLVSSRDINNYIDSLDI